MARLALCEGILTRLAFDWISDLQRSSFRHAQPFEMIARRSLQLYGAFLPAITGEPAVIGAVMLRPLIEASTVFRFLAQDPDSLIPLWEAERLRLRRSFANEHKRLSGVEIIGSEERVQIAECILSAKTAAIEAGWVARGARDSDMWPGLAQQIKMLHGTKEMPPSYVYGVKILNPYVHTGLAAFEFRQTANGPVVDDDIAPDLALGFRIAGAFGLATMLLTAYRMIVPGNDRRLTVVMDHLVRFKALAGS